MIIEKTVMVQKTEPLEFPTGNCYEVPQHQQGRREMILIFDDRIEGLYYNSRDHCGIYYLGIPQILAEYSLQFFESLQQVDELEYAKFKDKIIKGL